MRNSEVEMELTTISSASEMAKRRKGRKNHDIKQTDKYTNANKHQSGLSALILKLL